MQLNTFYKVTTTSNINNKRRLSLAVKHANVDQIAGANANSAYPNITLKEDVNLLDLAINGEYGTIRSETYSISYFS